MTGRVDRFATLVEETGSGRHHQRPADRDADLLALVGLAHRLGRQPHPPVRERFRDELQARLLAEFARQVATPGVPAARNPAEDQHAEDLARRASEEKTQVVRLVRPRPGGRGRLAVIIGVATGAVALSGVSMASGGAMPGDPLYSVKRSGEQAQLVLTVSDASRGQLHLEFARTRLVEARQVAPSEVAGVLAEMNRAITEGARLLFSAGMQDQNEAPIDSVAAFVAQQRSDLLELRAAVRGPGDPVRTSLDLLDAVELRANRLRAALAGGCSVAGVDELGPKPAC
jgi:hypothetical protein